MRELHDIEILRGVSHIIAPRDPNKRLKLSEAELPLGGGVADILAAHVDGGLHDAQAKAARFAVRDGSHAYSALSGLLAGEGNLIEFSQQLAQSLYAVAQSDQRVSDGTLAVLICQGVGDGDTTTRFPAVLKLDPSATLHTVTDTDAAGRTRVRYDVDPDSLPSKNEKIQKCVFVRDVDPAAAYEMLIVDRQRRGEVVGTFWVRAFLGAELVFDASERTKRLYKALLSAKNDVEQDLDATQLAALDEGISGAMVQASINVDEFVAALPVPQRVRTHVDDVISAALPDRAFELDPAVTVQFLRRRTFRADNGVRLIVPTEFYEQMIHVEDLDSTQGETRRRRVSFETTEWKET